MKQIGVMVAAAVLLGGLAAGAAPFFRIKEASGTPDLTGNWVGKKKYRDYDLSGQMKDDKGSTDFIMTITQAGADLAGTLTIDPTDDNPTIFPVTGRVGNGRFWAEGSLGFAEFFVTGSAKGDKEGNGKNLKATGSILFGPDFITEIKLTAKRP